MATEIEIKQLLDEAGQVVAEVEKTIYIRRQKSR